MKQLLSRLNRSTRRRLSLLLYLLLVACLLVGPAPGCTGWFFPVMKSQSSLAKSSRA